MDLKAGYGTSDGFVESCRMAGLHIFVRKNERPRNMSYRTYYFTILAKGGIIIFGYGMFIFSIFVGGYCHIAQRIKGTPGITG